MNPIARKTERGPVPFSVLHGLAVALVVTTAWAGLSPELQKALDEASHVYIRSERKSGDFGAPAEIWFWNEGGTVYVASPPTSWRVRRIEAGRARARIAIGKPKGPSFEATGAIVKDPALEKRLMDTFAKKYPEGWKRHAENFRTGFKDGKRVLIRYTSS